MKAALISIVALIVLDAIAFLLLKHEHKKRKRADIKAKEAAHNVKMLASAQKIKEEARSEADKKIEAVQSVPSGRERFNHILDELSNGKGAGNS